jgi:putative Holliday junction resolvase
LIIRRILGVDLGERRIGLALSDELGLTAQGLEVLPHRDDERSLAALVQMVSIKRADTVVFGLPRNMDGSSGPMAQKVLEFGKRLQMQLPQIQVAYWDERLTTSAAQRMLVDADLSRAKRKQVVDKVAAVLILQGYIDSLRNRAEAEKRS